ncbi:hypothetical protein FOFC_19893 [Fusarium oxysporum]|nr:hypothetical protein FOFC_19893 [Fusarium oxysporum]
MNGSGEEWMREEEMRRDESRKELLRLEETCQCQLGLAKAGTGSTVAEQETSCHCNKTRRFLRERRIVPRPSVSLLPLKTRSEFGDWLSQEYIQSDIWSVDDEDIVNRPKLPSRRFSQRIRIIHRVRSVRNNAWPFTKVFSTLF